MWTWIETCALPVIFPLKKNNGQIMMIDEQRYLADQASKRLGAVRFRQIRSEKGDYQTFQPLSMILLYTEFL